jgi:hypothetical protein
VILCGCNDILRGRSKGHQFVNYGGAPGHEAFRYEADAFVGLSRCYVPGSESLGRVRLQVLACTCTCRAGAM